MNQTRQIKVFHQVGSKAVRVYQNVAVIQTENDLVSCQSWLKKNILIFKFFFFFKYFLLIQCDLGGTSFNGIFINNAE